MRNLNEISGVAIMLFLVVGIGHTETNLQRGLLASGALLMGICMLIIKLKGKRSKRKGFLNC